MTHNATARLAGLLYFATLPTAGFAYRSGLVPKMIGIGLILGSFGYVAGFVLPVLGIVPPPAVSGALMAVTLVSEFAFMIWLMVKGAVSQAPAPTTVLT